jgi:hypothetical protein
MTTITYYVALAFRRSEEKEGNIVACKFLLNIGRTIR